ncbi:MULTISPECIES: hypothetical protein [unclassified Gordonia (in: high G+C Gram-positive bacteria)]|uniref:hypothetical protein n=1 Tax=Gordonia sp. VNQ95 TaxID=3156619 RepID=UPI0032B36F6A
MTVTGPLMLNVSWHPGNPRWPAYDVRVASMYADYRRCRVVGGGIVAVPGSHMYVEVDAADERIGHQPIPRTEFGNFIKDEYLLGIRVTPPRPLSR